MANGYDFTRISGYRLLLDTPRVFIGLRLVHRRRYSNHVAMSVRRQHVTPLDTSSILALVTL